MANRAQASVRCSQVSRISSSFLPRSSLSTASSPAGRVRALQAEVQRDGVGEQFGIGEAGQFDEAAAAAVADVTGGAQGEAGLADAARPGDRDEPRAAKQAGQPRELAAPADEAGNVGGQLPASLPGAMAAGRSQGIHAHLTSSRSALRIIPHRGHAIGVHHRKPSQPLILGQMARPGIGNCT